MLLLLLLLLLPLPLSGLAARVFGWSGLVSAAALCALVALRGEGSSIQLGQVWEEARK